MSNIARKLFNDDQLSKTILTDLLKWLKDGGDPFEPENDNARCGKALTNDDIACLLLWKNDPFHVSQKEMSIAVNKAIAQYGRVCSQTLYRGIPSSVVQKIEKMIANNKKLKLASVKSFSTSKDIAQKFTSAGVGSIAGKKEDSIGTIVKLHTSKKLFYIDEFEYLVKAAYFMYGLSEEDPNDELSDNQSHSTMFELEWLVPENAEFKIDSNSERLSFEY